MTIPALRRQQTTLLVVDMQERLLAAMEPNKTPELLRQVGILLDGAKALGLSVVSTEQYPKGLGPTVASLREKLAAPPIEKLEFSALANPRAKEAIAGSNASAIILCGVETHVCIYQTARDLCAAGYRVFIPRDAVLSRRESNVLTGLSLCEKAGAIISSVEAVLFDMVGGGGDSSFKEISRLLK